MSYVIDCNSQLKTFYYQWKKCHVPWSILIESSDASDNFLYTSVHFFSYKKISNISDRNLPCFSFWFLTFNLIKGGSVLQKVLR